MEVKRGVVANMSGSGMVSVEFVGEHISKRELLRILKAIKQEYVHSVRSYRKEQILLIAKKLGESKDGGDSSTKEIKRREGSESSEGQKLSGKPSNEGSAGASIGTNDRVAGSKSPAQVGTSGSRKESIVRAGESRSRGTVEAGSRPGHQKPVEHGHQ